MTTGEPSKQGNPGEGPQPPVAAANEAAETQDTAADPSSVESRPRFLIGSQRDPAAYRPRRRDWIPIEEPDSTATAEPPAPVQPVQPSGGGPVAEGPSRRRRAPHGVTEAAQAPGTPREETPPQKAAKDHNEAELKAPVADLDEPAVGPQKTIAPEVPSVPSANSDFDELSRVAEPTSVEPSTGGPAGDGKTSSRGAVALPSAPEPVPVGKLTPPNIREQLPPDLEEELTRALGDVAWDDMMRGGDAAAEEEPFEPESKHQGRVVAIRRGEVFVELRGREQGCLSLEQFDEPPPVDAVLEVVIQRLNPDDGLYDLTLPDKPVEVEDWGDLREGMLVDARVTGHNTGGLECQVKQLRAFIPMSQISLYRVEEPAELVGQQFTCLVTEANPQRRNLVLSRRAVLEREREEARQKFLSALELGQIHEGVVRKLVDFGAFVDIGGADGLLHISQLAWHRVQHPSEVLAEGQRIRVKIEKVDPATGKIGLAYRDLLENPWTNAATKYPANSVVRGTVTKLMEFGAFVQLEPGVEGLVHISELSHRRVLRAGEVVHEGDEVEVLVLSVDSEAQRISLSMKALAALPEPKKKEGEPAAEAAPPPPRKRRKPDQPLQGGLGRPPGGARFGLKW